MPNLYQVILTTRESQKQHIDIQKVANGQYKIVGAAGIPDLSHHTLGFDTAVKGLTNLDGSSDSFSCFGLSEHLKLEAPAFEFKDQTFFAKNLDQLQAALNRLQGQFVDSDEY